MNNLVDTFCNRLNKAIALRNIKPIELSEKTGIDKSKISSYMSGRYKAKQDGVFLLAQALNVSEAWLMGLDVPMERQSDKLENKLMELDKYMEKNNLDEIIFIPVFDIIDLTNNEWQTTPTGYSPFDFKTQNCDEDKNYFYYKISNNSMNVEKNSYILIENTQDVNINDIILYSINRKIDLGIYHINLKKEKDFKILGKYIK